MDEKNFVERLFGELKSVEQLRQLVWPMVHNPDCREYFQPDEPGRGILVRILKDYDFCEELLGLDKPETVFLPPASWLKE